MATSKHTYRFIEDPGHGWLEVSTAELRQLDIAHKVSTCSYQSKDGRTAYLEEDSDLSLWARARGFEAGATDWRDFWTSRVQTEHQENTFVRNLPMYQPPAGGAQ